MRFSYIFLTLISSILISSCGTNDPTDSNSGNNVSQVVKIIDSVCNKFVEIAKTNTNLTPGEVLVKTAEWVKTQTDVEDAWWYDSTYIDIKLKSGLKTTYGLVREGKDKLSDTRGGMSYNEKNNYDEILKSKNVINNKSVLIYAPFVYDEYPPDLTDLYSLQELTSLENAIKSYNKNFNVKILKWDDASISAIDSFRYYGVVLISTHGLPDGFYTGAAISGIRNELLTEDEIKKILNSKFKPNGYQKYLNGNFRFAYLEHIANIRNWQEYLTYRGDFSFLLIANSEYLYTLAPMPNTVIVGNFCYSGWGIPGDTKMKLGGKIISNNPIRYAFTNLTPIAYYSYGYDDGKSAPVGNEFAKRMEMELLKSLISEGDSTGNAYLNNKGEEYTEASLGLKSSGDPNMPFKLFGAKDYSFDDCVTEFTDERDGQKYKAVCIGKQNWMAENLRYNAQGSVIYNNNNAFLPVYGRLYSWNTMMNGESGSSSNPSGRRGICPKGWHIPSKAEWEELLNFVGYDTGKLKDTTRWKTPNTEHTNQYGFTALPGGIQTPPPTSGFSWLSSAGFWWSTDVSTTQMETHRIILNIVSEKNVGSLEDAPLQSKASCRCVKD